MTTLTLIPFVWDEETGLDSDKLMLALCLAWVECMQTDWLRNKTGFSLMLNVKVFELALSSQYYLSSHEKSIFRFVFNDDILQSRLKGSWVEWVEQKHKYFSGIRTFLLPQSSRLFELISYTFIVDAVNKLLRLVFMIIEEG